MRYFSAVSTVRLTRLGRCIHCRGSMAALRDLSPSLADIAAFMHEVELQHGLMSQKNDGRGIERIRQFAYKLQSLLVAHAENVCTMLIPRMSADERYSR